ncbi:protein CNPPD1-like [Sycon ciliatum]|uniref:protein CNPPD1-like n=1 Tax=Sycon ciliatum TaxID=27933 RepID=UPI0031F68C93
MASCLGERRSSSVYLLAPHDTPGLSSCDAEVCARSQAGLCGDDLDHSHPTEFLNDLVRDQVDGRAFCMDSTKPCEKPLHAGDIAAVERTLQVSSCALIVGLLYAERLQAAEAASSSSCEETTIVPDDDRLSHAAAPAPGCSCAEPATDPPSDDNFNFSAADLFLMCVLTANKYLYDEGEPDSCLNTDMALAGRRKTKRVNQMERAFLHKIGWRLHVSHEEFTSFLKRVERVLALRAIRRPGYGFLYQDAACLWDVLMSQCGIVLSSLLQVAGVVFSAYTLLAVVLFIQPVMLTPASSTGPACGKSVCTSSRAVENNTMSGPPASLANAPPARSTDMWVSPYAQSTLETCQSCTSQQRSATHSTGVQTYAASAHGQEAPAQPKNQTASKPLLLPHRFGKAYRYFFAAA